MKNCLLTFVNVTNIDNSGRTEFIDGGIGKKFIEVRLLPRGEKFMKFNVTINGICERKKQSHGEHLSTDYRTENKMMRKYHLYKKMASHRVRHPQYAFVENEDKIAYD